MASDLALVRPLGPAEIIDRAVALAVRHLRPLFPRMLALQAAAVALARLQGRAAQDLLAAAGDLRAAAPLLPRLAVTGAGVLAGLVLVQLLSTAVVAAAVTPALAPHASPRPHLRRVAWAALTASVLQLGALAAAPALGALPGLAVAARGASTAALVVGSCAAALGAAVLGLLAFLRYALAPCAAAVEGCAGLAALRRSAVLMRAAPGARLRDRPALRASAVLLASFALAAAVGGVAGLPRLIATRLQPDPGLALVGGLPLPLEVALTGVEVVVGAALQPFSLAAMVVFYFDRRARAEGLDLELWAAGREGRP